MSGTKSVGRPRSRRPIAAALLWEAAAAAVCAAGCATVATGSSQTLSIETDPPGGYCTLTRAGEIIGVVNPTPGSVAVDKSKKDILVACRKEGYRDEQATLSSSLAGATFGNILLGGLIGIGVDAMSGATSKYATSLTVQLVPTSFASGDERDAYFDKLKDHLRQQSASQKELINKNCKDNNCDSRLKNVDDEETAALAKLDMARDQATITGVK